MMMMMIIIIISEHIVFMYFVRVDWITSNYPFLVNSKFPVSGTHIANPCNYKTC